MNEATSPSDASPLVRNAGSATVGLVWLFTSALLWLLLVSLGRVDGVPRFLIVALALLAGLSCWRPAFGLLLIISGVPVATWLGLRWHGGVPWPEVLVVAFLSGYTARQVSKRHRDSGGRGSAAIGAAIVVIGASLAVHLLFERATSGSAEVLSTMWRLVTRDYFLDTSQVQADAAMRLIEGLLLLRAAWATAAAEPPFSLHALRAFVLGAAAAGAVNVGYLWTSALRRESPMRTFLSYVATIRFNRQYADVNAAGSYFVMSLFAALGMLISTPRVLPAVATVLIALSLMFSGSRAAVVAGVVCALPLGARWMKRVTPSSRLHRGGIAAALIVLVCIFSAGIYALLKRNPISSIGALEIRQEFAGTSWRMLKTQPFFGVGVGEFWLRSGEFSSVELLTRYPQAQHENAHNNFLQLLTELGLVGFAAVIMVLGIAASACAHQLRSHPDDWPRWMLAAGLVAFVITWLAGHPLLLDAPAFSFWLLLGTTAGWGEDPSAPPSAAGLPMRYVPVALAVLAVISVPLRVRSETARANLEHQGIGLSGWQTGEDGIMYRLAGVDSTVFLPSSARVVTLPIRAHDPSQVLDVELRLDNRVADIVRVTGQRWFMLQLPLPETADAPRFRRLHLIVRPPLPGIPLLKVGKATPR